MKNFPLTFHLEEIPTDLEEQLKQISPVHPSDTLGAYIAPIGGSKNRVKIAIPRLKVSKSFKINIQKDVNFEKSLHFFNFVCSLQNCILQFSLEEDYLKIQFTTSTASTDLNLLESYYQRLFGDK